MVMSHQRSPRLKPLLKRVPPGFLVDAAWLKHLDKTAVDLGSGPRALVKDGKLHPVYRIYVPADFVPSKAEGAPNA